MQKGKKQFTEKGKEKQHEKQRHPVMAKNIVKQKTRPGKDSGYVAAVIVSYNVGDYVAECIRALLAESESLKEIVVVDNASSDNTLQRIKEAFEKQSEKMGVKLNLIGNSTNQGFAKAVNSGAKAVNMGSKPEKDEKLLIINPDAVIVKGSIAKMCSLLDENPEAGVVGCRILDKNYAVQSSARGFPDLMTPFFGRRAIWSRLIPLNPITNRNLTDTRSVKEACTVDWVSGAVMMVRRDEFLENMGFDEDFFMYWEDADFCLRMKKKGLLTYYLPSARAIHFTGCSSKKRKFLSSLSFYFSAFKYYLKNIRPDSILAFLVDIPACAGVFLFIAYSFIKTGLALISKPFLRLM